MVDGNLEGSSWVMAPRQKGTACAKAWWHERATGLGIPAGGVLRLWGCTHWDASGQQNLLGRGSWVLHWGV